MFLQVTHAGERRADGHCGGRENEGVHGGATADVLDGQVGGLAQRGGGGDGGEGAGTQAALRRKTWQHWGSWHWEVRGGRSSHDSKLLGWTDGRMVASFVELSWEPGRFGGGRGEGSGLHILKVRRLVVDHWRMDCGDRKNVGGWAELWSKLYSHIWLCHLEQ